ncbi:PREDICTED: tyrosine-protein phosphatase non-receptor type 4-like [Amphimedon queenslandica]|uniref:protein-tyrosine-phosphatase n=1 Tax=Amphimedon queenslandica TaxID=400682 RepID=A0A1X7VUY1_AMPQE|nr:PREDICTED: tyrosine-protein phosphatase non-receptor type 4-like [Amphimedon queenslandica]|eukprot:XP_019850847.1 PREDICTED: tyrosine-protein phosphatase non-receptor type 4-like [Amphimedon queenslandica]
MAFLKRIPSVRKKNSYRLAAVSPTDRPSSQSVSESAAAKLSSGLIQCHITLLDDSMFTCDLNKHSLGSTLLDEVYAHADIIERDYFGLSYSENGYNKWLQSDKPLKKQFKGGSCSVVLELRVKFYTSDPVFLVEELTRYLFFRQIKKDLLENRLICPTEAAAILSAFALQAELGDYDPVGHPPGYVSEFRFISNQDEVFEKRVSEIHQEIRGQTTSEAEYNFLQYARQLEFYGVEQYPAADDRGVSISLGVCSHGIVVFKDLLKLNTFTWPQVLKITYSKKKFYIELRKTMEMDERVVGFHMDNHEASKRLWVACIEHHAFFRMSEVSKGPQRGSPFRKSKVKITRKTEKQVVEASKSIARDGQRIRRTPSKRYPKRSPLVGDNDDLMRRRANTEIRRTGSLRDYGGGRPVVEVRRGQSPSELTPRRLSATREHTPAMSSPRSPLSEAEDDFTAADFLQFQLGETEESGFTTLQISDRHNHHHDKEVGEYYDESNAAEEFANQMTIDDLASEGFLMIRLNPDSEGRFGFHVKGGLDLNLPVFVSKVKEDSPASQCQPPLEEGDQVLFVNGMSTDTATHIEVITAIKSSLDRQPPQLVLIIKPRDLSRVDPTASGDSAPQFSSDPHTLLRESMVSLKESVLNGSVLVSFDRLYRKKPGMLTIASKLPQNLSKNRYRDITAYDITRVHLLDGPVDYINANYVNMDIPSTCQVVRYIVTQGPMQNTCIDFWQMVWEQGCGFIVMLTDIMEEGKVKCCRYWPDQGNSTEYGPFQIYCESDRKDNLCCTRHFVLKNNRTKEEKPIIHLQFLDWSESNVPLVKADFLRFIRRLHTLRHGMEDPLVVHCSGGIDRSGIFVAMETALTKIEIVEAFNPLEIVRMMRDQRGMMLPALNQYKFFCDCIVQAYEEDYIEIDLSNHANNVKTSP